MLSVRTAARLVPGGSLASIHETSDGRPVAVTGAFGRGEVIAVSDPSIATNDGLHRAGNAGFLLAVVAAGPSRTVRFDERRHGFVSERNVMGYVGRHGLEAAALQVALAFVALAWAAMSPRARPRVPPPREGIESRELVTAMSSMYARLGLGSHALDAYRRRAVAAALASRGVPSSPWPEDAVIEAHLRALGVRNWNGWSYVRDAHVAIRAAIPDAGPPAELAGPLAGVFAAFDRAARALGLARLGGRGDRALLSYARFASRFEREVRTAARIPLDEVA